MIKTLLGNEMENLSSDDIKLVDVLQDMVDTQNNILISMKLILIVMEEILKRLDGEVVAEA